MIRKNIQNILFVFLLLLLVFRTNAQVRPSLDRWSYLLEVKEGDTPTSIQNEDHFYLANIPDLDGLALLRQNGLELVRKLDSSTAIVRPLGIAAVWVESSSLVLGKANNLWKLSPNLIEDKRYGILRSYSVKSDNPMQLIIELDKAGVSYKRLTASLFRVNTTLEILNERLLPLPYVLYIGKESQEVVMDSRVLDLNLNPNTVNRIHHDFPDLTGTGLTLSIKEGMFDVTDMDIRLRHLSSSLEGTQPSLHATEMATIAGGAGNSSLNGLGVAREVTLTGSLLEELLPDADEDYQRLNVWVQNHSYGTNIIENFYGASAEVYDQSANNNPGLLHVFSAGNLGTSVPEEGAYFGIIEPLANITGNFKMSKNTLSVASVDTVGRVVAFVSKGPAHDGRIKPELVTYSVAGSSNSAAMVSGIAILLQQAYQEIHGNMPASALLKALLINSAEDVLNEGPDYTSGYGNVDAHRTMANLKAGYFFHGSLADGQRQTFDLTIPDNTANVKITLVWNDPAANANANIALMNDLDLSIAETGGQTYTSWVLNSNPENLSDLAIRGIDRLNNVEQVTIANPTNGVISINVDAFQIPDGIQDFYVTYQWDEKEVFDWSFPTGSDNMPYNGETVSYFRWKSTFGQRMGRLEYSLDNGQTWLLVDNVPLSQGYYRWDAPQVRSAALARMVVDSQSYPTDEFIISRPERIGVGFSCADSVRLQWSEVPEAESYQILTFGDAFLEQVSTVTDTSFTFRKSDFSSKLFSIQPVIQGGVMPLRADTFDYDFQGVGCYLVSFFARAMDDGGVKINTQLGTIAGVEEVIVERRVELGEFEQIAIINEAALTLGTDVIDSSPFQGLNEYRAQIVFENGEQIDTETSSVYYLTSKPFLVFPNPLPQGEQLNVFSKIFIDNPEVTFSMYNNAGIPLFSLQLNSDRASVNLDRLKPGSYFYRIIAPGYSYKGRVILE